MGDLVEFQRRKRTQPKTRQWRRKLVASAVLLLAVAIVTAGRFVVSAPARLPNTVNAIRVAGNTSFTLCAEWRQPNCVIDGDTVHYNSISIRLEDIDAPETHDPKCASELALGRRATKRLKELMNAGPFEIVYSGGRNADRYGRELRLLERYGRSLGSILVDEGLARLWDGARHPWCE